MGFDPVMYAKLNGRTPKELTGTNKLEDLTWRRARAQRMVDLQPASLLFLDERFDGDYGLYTEAAPTSDPATTTTYAQGLTLTDAGTYFQVFQSGLTLDVPFAMLTMAVRAFPASNQSFLYLGLYKDANNYCLGWFDPSRGRANVELKIGGSFDNGSAVDVGAVTGAFEVGVSINANEVTMLLKVGETWKPIMTHNVESSLALWATANLAAYPLAWGAKTSTAADSHTIDAVRMGTFGHVGMRDYRLVTFDDGTPIERNGMYYLAATCAGLSKQVDQQSTRASYTGIFEFNPHTYSLRQTAAIFFERSGRRVGDHGGTIIYDRATKRWVVFASNFGDYTTGTSKYSNYVAYFDADILNGVHIASAPTQWLVPDLANGSPDYTWSPDIKRIGGVWYVTWVDSSGGEESFGTLATADTVEGPFTIITRTNAMSVNYEAATFARVGGEWRWCIGSNVDDVVRVYDLDGVYVGDVGAAELVGFPPTRANMIPVSIGGTTRYVWPLFTAAGWQAGYVSSQGTTVLLESVEANPGAEFSVVVPQ